MKLKTIIFLNLLFCYSTTALAVCSSLKFTVAATTWNFNANPAPTLQVTAYRIGSGGCDYFFTFSAGQSANYNNRLLYNSTYTIPYQVYQSPLVNILKDLPAATSSNDVVAGTFPPGGPLIQHHNYSPTLGLTGYSRFGYYSDTITVKFYNGTVTGSKTYRGSQNVTYTYTMPKLIDLSLVNTGAIFNPSDVSQTMNFGSLSVGQVQSFDVVLQYNAGYVLKFSSANDGKMKNTAGNYYVSYTMAVNGSPINLVGSSGTPVTVATATGVSTSGGLRLPVSATITSLGAQAAGTHNDTISMTVTSAE